MSVRPASFVVKFIILIQALELAVTVLAKVLKDLQDLLAHLEV